MIRKLLTPIFSVACCLILSIALISCAEKQPKYVIGISQCSDDIWREKQNAELRMAAYFHDDVELRFASAYDSDERQVEQIDSLVALGIDLLIVAPNQVQTISPAIDRAYDRGIPVIVFERKTNSEKYTAFMGADNYEMGHLMGEYIASRLKGRGRVMEIMGLKGSSPAIERHKGFADALADHPAIETVATLQGDWTEASGYTAMKHYRESLDDIDFVFGQNDRMALGARKAFLEKGGRVPLFCGIDGLPGEGNGIACVRDSILDASYIYPTHGDKLLELAVSILDGKPYEREIQLMAAIVTRDNAKVLLMQNEELMQQADYLDQLHRRASVYLDEIADQRTGLLLAIGFIVLLFLLLVVTYLYFLQRARLYEERTKMEREQLDFYTQVSHQLRTPLTLIQGPLEQLAETREVKEAGAEASGLFAIIRRNTQHLTELISQMLDMQVKSGGSVDGLLDPGQGQEPVPIIRQESEQSLSETVLIVDDNADIRAYLRTILQDRYQVSEAVDGQQGLTVANEIVPDLIVSDVMMPVMNGLEFCQRIKGSTATSHIPVILLTARALSKYQIEGYESGADAYITKPFAADLLLARISNLLKNRVLLKGLFGSAEPKREAPDSNVAASSTAEPGREDAFMLKFRDFVERNMTDSDLSVETIGAELGLSRVQLYRKVKALTGQSPVELLRRARLQRGRQLLQSTDKTVSEVAYEVGFSAPSYFTKCFKDEYGISPSDL